MFDRKLLSGWLSLSSVSVALAMALFERTLLERESFALVSGVATVLAAMAAYLSVVWSRRLAAERTNRRVFLIYAREDLESARSISAELKRHGFRPWLDIDELTPGQVWAKAVLRTLEGSSAAVVLISQHLSKKGFVQKELEFALNTMHDTHEDISPIVPVRLDESPVPDRLAHVQWVNLFEPDGMDKLVAGLKKVTAPNRALHPTAVREQPATGDSEHRRG